MWLFDIQQKMQKPEDNLWCVLVLQLDFVHDVTEVKCKAETVGHNSSHVNTHRFYSIVTIAVWNHGGPCTLVSNLMGS